MKLGISMGHFILSHLFSFSFWLLGFMSYKPQVLQIIKIIIYALFSCLFLEVLCKLGMWQLTFSTSVNQICHCLEWKRDQFPRGIAWSSADANQREAVMFPTHSHNPLCCFLQLRKRVKLEGKELEEYLEKEKIKKEAAKKLEQSKEWVLFGRILSLCV